MKSETKMSAEKVVKQPKPKLMNIKLEKLHPFENHPYKVLDDDSMTELKESIAEQGVEEMTVDVYKVRYKTVKSSRFDTTAFKKAMPDLAAQFMRETESRRFTVA